MTKKRRVGRSRGGDGDPVEDEDDENDEKEESQTRLTSSGGGRGKRKSRVAALAGSLLAAACAPLSIPRCEPSSSSRTKGARS